jgi:serine phosphatase RsbU (regulator of sigma subunit)
MKTAQLKVTDNFGIQKVLPLDRPVFTIGRKSENDLYLLSASVSRQHAEIVYDDGSYYLLDKGSKSGCYVNDCPVTRAPLKHLDRIRIGGDDGVQIQFFDDRSAGAFPPSSERVTLELSPAGEPATSASDELQKLARFLEVNQAFRSSLTPEDVLRVIVDAAIEMTAAERGFLMLKNEAGELEFKVARDRSRNSLPGDTFAMSRSVVNKAVRTNRSIIINDPGESGSSSTPESAVNLDLRSIICIPLHRFRFSERMGATSVHKREVMGVLYVDSRVVRGALSSTSIQLLESLSFEAAKCLDSVRLLGEEKEKQKLEHEFAMAWEVQSALQPAIFRQFDSFEVAARSIPCRYVGGDFYDVIALDDCGAAFVLGDVSGKGISAALLAAMAQGGIQTQLAIGLSLAAAIANLNRLIAQRSAANRFITLFCGMLDRQGNFSYVNAGHNPPILARTDGRVELLSTNSLVLGAFDSAEYQARSTRVEPGDVVVVFTDGVTEAVNGSNEMFGDERLESLVKSLVSSTAQKIMDRILEEVLAFTRGQPQGDDITLLAIKVKAEVQSPKSVS